jgi:type II secretory pathway pseudopilin PulG
MLELIVVLAVIAIITAALTPMITSYLDDAKVRGAEADVKQIAGALLKLSTDVGHFPLYRDGTRTSGEPDVHLLRGPGNDPVDYRGPGAGLGQPRHDAGVGLGPGPGWFGTPKIGELADHLTTNDPGAVPYRTAGRHRWRGPYLEHLAADPWGHRYLVNIKHANPGDDEPKAIWVLSAGPNGTLDTSPTLAAGGTPVPAGDDIAYRIK